jgi:hypothetical protein
MPEAITLDYGKAPPRWRRWVRRWFWLMLLVIVVGAGWFWQDTISRHVAAWYWMRQCLAYSPPPGKVVWEEDPVEAKKLLSGKPREYLVWGQGAYARTRCWDMLMEQYRPHFDSGLGSVLFLHQRAGRGPGGGQKRLVRVWSSDFEPGGLHLMADDWSTSSIFSMPEYVGQYHAGPAGPVTIKVARIYAGQADPKDNSHFAFEYETPIGGHGKVDGWLEADDSITLVVGPVTPATTRP